MPNTAAPAVVLLTIFTALAPSFGAASADPPGHSSAEAQAAIARVRVGLVQVEHHLRQHQGQRPEMLVGRAFGGAGGAWQVENADMLIDQERPLESGGFLVGDDLVLAFDPPLHPRFVDRIVVRFGDDLVEATPQRWILDEPATVLRLSRPLRGAEALRTGDGGDAEPAWSIQWSRIGGVWTAEARPFATRTSVTVETDGDATNELALPNSIFVDAQGQLMGATYRGVVGPGRSLLGDPLKWPALEARQRDALLTETKTRAEQGVLRASLRFRSPRRRQGGGMGFDPYQQDGPTLGTELETLAVILGDDSAAILASLPPSVTARLESIVLHSSDGSEHPVRFLASLRDLGVLTVRLESPVGVPIALAHRSAIAYRDRLLPAALVRVVGRQRVADTGHVRLERFEVRWWNEPFPILVGEPDRTFVFGPDGELVALPMMRRVPTTSPERWRGEQSFMMSASLLDAAIRGDGFDPSNVPLDEETEARTAWLGAIMQALDADLADAMGVSELTDGGRFGGVVTSVYPESPAARAGVAAGAVILAIHTPRRPRPIEIRIDESEMGFPGAFPWERLDEVPEEYYDQVPMPWPTIEDLTARTLTEIGLGSEFELEVFENGKLRRFPMIVETSPPHFGNAPRIEDERLGVAVRDLSFEIRNYLRIGPDEPGVVVSSLTPGGRASLAGLRPFEIIVEIDGEPVSDAAGFATLVANRTDIRLSVRRGTRSRAVRIGLE